MWGRGPRGNNTACSTLTSFQSLPPLPTSKLGPSAADAQVSGFFVPSRTLWVSPRNSPARLGVSPATTTLTRFFSQRFWGFISPNWYPGLLSLSCSAVVHPSLSACKCGTIWSSSHCLATSPLCPGCLCPPLLPVWMNVSSLIPSLLDFHIVQLSGSSGYYFF